MLLQWFDTHCHLDRFPTGYALADILSRAAQAGVDKIMVPGVAGAPQPVIEAAENVEMFYAWGIHPGFINSAKLDFSVAEPWFPGAKPLAIGECGLDKRLKVDLECQIRAFVWQLELARLHDLPVVVHQVGHSARILEILQSADLKRGFIMHSYSGSAEMAQRFVEAGGKISLSASCLKNPEKLPKLLAAVSPAALLLETDAPDMRLPDWPGSSNEPVALPQIAANVARICGLAVENLAEVVYTNAVQFFRLPERINNG